MSVLPGTLRSGALRFLVYCALRFSLFLPSPELALNFPFACRLSKLGRGERDGWRSNQLRASSKLPRRGTPRATYHDSQKICHQVCRSLARAPSVRQAHCRAFCRDWNGATGAFLRWCPSYGSFRRVQPGKDWTGRRSFLARRRACSARFRVARVSRL